MRSSLPIPQHTTTQPGCLTRPSSLYRHPSLQLKLEVQQLHAGMVRWCRAHFGEAFSAWMHVKLIKSYVESVMRYGLPVDFSAFMLAPKKGQDAKVRIPRSGRVGYPCLL